MKKVFLLIWATVAFSVHSFAQNDSKVQALKNDIAKSDAAIEDAKKKVNPSTWMTRGKLFYDVYGLNIHFLRTGMPAAEINVFFGKPLNEPVITGSGTVEYSRIKLNIENGVLSTWEEKESITDHPLKKAVDAYKTAQSLDEKGKLTKKINEGYTLIGADLEAKMLNENALRKFSDAYQSAIQKIEVSNLLGYADTSFHYYAGFFAYAQSEIDNSLWKEAVYHLDKAVSLGFKEEGVYGLLCTASMNIGDTAQALVYIDKGFALNPNDLPLIYQMINYYLQRNESEKALTYITKAKVDDPKNATLLFAEGTLLDRLGRGSEALAAYDASIAIDPTSFGPYFNKGVVFYNSAVKLMEEADKARTNAEFERQKNVADDEFYKAIAPMEKAYEINPTDVPVMETLKSLYYRLRTKYPDMQQKYDDIVKKLGGS
jgi:Flp pilus assembly protein TadD